MGGGVIVSRTELLLNSLDRENVHPSEGCEQSSPNLWFEPSEGYIMVNPYSTSKPLFAITSLYQSALSLAMRSCVS